ncbi:MAG: DNA repair protein RecN [bacterium]
MLRALRIENFALIDELEIELSPGMTVLSGETGAGKSVIIDALGIALGARAAADLIRTGEESARVEALFDIAQNRAALACLQEMGWAADGADTLLVAREINRAGKNICRINGRIAATAMLKEVSQHLADIHSQHEHQSLLRVDRHITLLDYFGGNDIAAVKQTVRELSGRAKKLRAKIRSLGGSAEERLRKIDLLTFQRDEIAAANLRENEETELLSERNVVAGAEKLYAFAAAAGSLLYEGEGEQTAVVDLMGRVAEELKNAVRIDPRLIPLQATVDDVLAVIDDLAREIRTYRESIEFDPARLAEIERRLDILSQLKRKYGGSVREVIDYGRQVEAELRELNASEAAIAACREELTGVSAILAAQAGKLSSLRRESAARLERRIEEELHSLGMKEARFAVEFASPDDAAGAETAEIGPDGYDRVEFLLSPNPGEPPKPLVRIASGGEVARIMLALKVVLAAADRIPTLVFDEVDAGIGGRAAQAVAAKLNYLARDFQVLCITHLPQIAGMGDCHFAISKEVSGGRTRTCLRLLDPDARVSEIARMLGGGDESTITREHAREMLERAQAAKAAPRPPENKKEARQ